MALVTQRERFKVHASSSSSDPELQREEGAGHAAKIEYKWNNNWDHRSPKASAKARRKEGGGAREEDPVPVPTASRHLILIRHGQYEIWHEKSELKVLTELGRKQSAITGERLKELGGERPYAMLYYSTMPRATETAMVISESLPAVAMVSCDLLREGAPVRPDPPHKTWRPEEYEFFRDSPRIEAAFRKYFHRAAPSQKEDSTEIIVCHANVIRYFVCRALQLPPEAWLRMSLAHGSITRVTIRPNGRVGLRSLGSAEHMPAKLVTFQ